MASRIEPAMILAAVLSLAISVPTTLAQTGVVATNRAAEDARKRGDSAFEKKAYAQAMRWYQKADQLGDAEAMNSIGYMYDNGLGVRQDAGSAFIFYKAAADHGLAKAKYNIAVDYESGAGVPRDPCLARIWMQDAASGGDQDARQWLTDHLVTGSEAAQPNIEVNVDNLNREKMEHGEYIGKTITWRGKVLDTSGKCALLVQYNDLYRADVRMLAPLDVIPAKGENITLRGTVDDVSTVTNFIQGAGVQGEYFQLRIQDAVIPK